MKQNPASPHLTHATGTRRQLGAAAKHIKERHIANCIKADPAYGAGVAQAIASAGKKSTVDERKIA
jgi:catalase